MMDSVSVLVLLICFLFGLGFGVMIGWVFNVMVCDPIVHKLVCEVANRFGCNVVEERAWYKWIRVKPAYRIESAQPENNVSIYDIWMMVTETTNCTVVLRGDVISVSGVLYKIDPSLTLHNKTKGRASAKLHYMQDVLPI